METDLKFDPETKTVTILKDGYYKLGDIFKQCKAGEIYKLHEIRAHSDGSDQDSDAFKVIKLG